MGLIKKKSQASAQWFETRSKASTTSISAANQASYYSSNSITAGWNALHTRQVRDCHLWNGDQTKNLRTCWAGWKGLVCQAPASTCH